MHPVHIIMGAADHQRINKTESAVSRENSDKDPGEEMTMLGWTFTGKSINTSGEVIKEFFVIVGKDEFEKLNSMETLELADYFGSSLLHASLNISLRKI